MSDSIIKGRLITRKNDLFVLNITEFKSTKLFTFNIGFNVERKHQKLVDSVEIFESFPTNERLNKWNKKYVKLNKRWISQKSNNSSTIDEVHALTGTRTRVAPVTGVHPKPLDY